MTTLITAEIWYGMYKYTLFIILSMDPDGQYTKGHNTNSENSPLPPTHFFFVELTALYTTVCWLSSWTDLYSLTGEEYWNTVLIASHFAADNTSLYAGLLLPWPGSWQWCCGLTASSELLPWDQGWIVFKQAEAQRWKVWGHTAWIKDTEAGSIAAVSVLETWRQWDLFLRLHQRLWTGSWVGITMHDHIDATFRACWFQLYSLWKLQPCLTLTAKISNSCCTSAVMAGRQLLSTEYQYHSSRTTMPSACVSKTLCSKNNDLHKKDGAQVGGTLKTQDLLFMCSDFFKISPLLLCTQK